MVNRFKLAEHFWLLLICVGFALILGFVFQLNVFAIIALCLVANALLYVWRQD